MVVRSSGRRSSESVEAEANAKVRRTGADAEGRAGRREESWSTRRTGEEKQEAEGEERGEHKSGEEEEARAREKVSQVSSRQVRKRTLAKVFREVSGRSRSVLVRVSAVSGLLAERLERV